MTTARQDREFIDLILGDMIKSFDASIVLEWAAKNFSPEDVFDEIALDDWAKRNNYAKEK